MKEHAMRQRWKEFWQDEKGGVAIFIGLTIVVLVVISGIAIDYTRSAMIHQRIQYASDPASVAGALLPSGTPANQRIAVADRYFNANYPDNYLGLARPATGIQADDGNGQVRATGTLQVANTFMPINNGPNVNQVNSTALAGRSQIGNLDLVWVVDQSSEYNNGGNSACTIVNGTGSTWMGCMQDAIISGGGASLFQIFGCGQGNCPPENRENFTQGVVGIRGRPHPLAMMHGNTTNGNYTDTGVYCRPPGPNQCENLCFSGFQTFVYRDLTPKAQGCPNDHDDDSYGWYGIERADTLLNNPASVRPSKVIIFIGDGELNEEPGVVPDAYKRFNDACDIFKNKGGKIYTLQFGPANKTVGANIDSLKNCASEPKAQYFKQPLQSAAALRAAVREIVSELSKLAGSNNGRIRLLE